MNRDEAAARLILIMRDVFDADDLVYRDSLSLGEVKDWDSLSHLRLLTAAEKAFGLRFTSGEIDSLKSAGDVLDAILVRRSSR